MCTFSARLPLSLTKRQTNRQSMTRSNAETLDLLDLSYLVTNLAECHCHNHILI